MKDELLLVPLLLVTTALFAASGYKLNQLPQAPVVTEEEVVLDYEMILVAPTAQEIINGSRDIE